MGAKADSTLSPATLDAVVVVPGIMGSELADANGKIQWGLKPAVAWDAHVGNRLAALHVTDTELAGAPRLRATRLLRVPTYTPFCRGLEPYSDLLNLVSATVVDRRALLEFPYDWRLSIAHNAQHLVKQCEQHLSRWREIVALQRYCDPRDVRVVVIAHSMGGLIARYAGLALGLSELLRQIITLGTPYFGAVRTVQMLADGSSPMRRLIPPRTAKGFALTCPGVYDLLPRYKCVVDNGSLRQLTATDLTAIGASSEMANAARSRWEQLHLPSALTPPVPTTHAVVGTVHPTLQSLTIDAGSCRFHDTLLGVDHEGDGTVYRNSAVPGGISAHALPQTHGALAVTPEALNYVWFKLTGGDLTPELAPFDPVRITFPDIAEAGCAVTVLVQGRDPVGISVDSIDLATGTTKPWTLRGRNDDDLVFSNDGLRPGLHRIRVTVPGRSPVSEIVLVVAPS